MSHSAPSVGRLTAWIFALVIVATPFAALVWEMLNQLMSGRMEPRGMLLGLAGLGVLLAIWRLTWRSIQRWEGEPRENQSTPGGASS
ncbi:MAG TPA: hypothetical protein VMK65_06690 [Longimicrobiales bacterium]|nr:hypothetical protein [Longimicrobiales bacterium]